MTTAHTPGPWKFRDLECDDDRGMGYVSGGPNDTDLFHTGAMELWAVYPQYIGNLSFWFGVCAGQRLMDDGE